MYEVKNKNNSISVNFNSFTLIKSYFLSRVFFFFKSSFLSAYKHTIKKKFQKFLTTILTTMVHIQHTHIYAGVAAFPCNLKNF